MVGQVGHLPEAPHINIMMHEIFHSKHHLKLHRNKNVTYNYNTGPEIEKEDQVQITNLRTPHGTVLVFSRPPTFLGNRSKERCVEMGSTTCILDWNRNVLWG
jgi:hypothetical protein